MDRRPGTEDGDRRRRGRALARAPRAPIDPEFYQPLAQLDEMAWGWTRRTLFVVARTDADPAALAPGVRGAVARVDPGVPLFGVRTMEERMAQTLETARFNAILLALLGARRLAARRRGHLRRHRLL